MVLDHQLIRNIDVVLLPEKKLSNMSCGSMFECLQLKDRRNNQIIFSTSYTREALRLLKSLGNLDIDEYYKI